jgi:hypothetical protein
LVGIGVIADTLINIDRATARRRWSLNKLFESSDDFQARRSPPAGFALRGAI